MTFRDRLKARPTRRRKPKLVYAATKRCPCGAGLAYDPHERGDGVFRGPSAWDCSAILLGEAIPSGEPGAVTHTDRLPFAFYEIKSEGQPSANGATTRPVVARRRPWWRRLRIPVLGLALLAVWLALPVTASATVHTSPAGLRMIEGFEGLTLTVQPDPVGQPTICYGITSYDGSLPSHATKAQCERMLKDALARGYEPSVRALFSSRGELHGLFNQHRFDSLVSLSFNVGVGVLSRLADTRDLRSIASRLLAYDHAGGVVLPGLSIRRHAEAALFLSPMGRFELFAPHEIHLILQYDRLRGHTSPAAQRRRVALQAAMRADARGIARVARRQPDWLSSRRLDRYEALLRRLPRAKARA